MAITIRVPESVAELLTPGDTQDGICQVHHLLMGDDTVRPVRYMALARCLVCDECRDHWLCHGRAMMKRLREATR
jgi:hypothetical protein